MAANPRLPLWQDSKAIEGFIRPLYNAKLPYHNWNHALDTRRHAFRVANFAMMNGVEIQTVVLNDASLGHDLERDKIPGIEHTSRSPERHAASVLMRIMLDYLHAPADVARETGDAVLSTAVSAQCETDTEICLYRGDVHNLEEQEAVFLGTTFGLFLEDRYLKHEPSPLKLPPGRLLRAFTDYAVNQRDTLEIILKKDRPLGDYEATAKDESLFYVNARQNVNLLTNRKLDLILPELMPQILARHSGRLAA
jgi:hypothetical protein